MRKILCRAVLYLLVCLLVLSFSALLLSCHAKETAPGEIRYEDALGRQLTLKKKPERVAALLGSFADVWMLSGGTLCAAAEDAWEDFNLPLDGAVDLGGAHTPSLELLISAEPELVLASAATASNVEMKDMLEAMGIVVVYFSVDCFDDYLNMLRLCTRLTGREDLYVRNGLALQTEIEAVKTRYAAAVPSDAERRILLLRASSSSVRAKGSRGTILGEMLSDMGCINIADSDATLLENLSVEAILREDPYRIFVVTMGSDTELALQSLEKMIKENPAWSGLEAIEAGRFYVMEKQLFNLKPNARWAEAYQRLYEKLTEE